MKGKVNIKKTLLVLCFFIISVFTFADGENYYDYQALLVGDSKGNIIKKENITTVRPLASITKVMTSILTLEKIRSGAISMNDRVTISETASVIPYGIKLIAGKEYTVEDLLKATIIRSSNNAAYALAEYVSGGNVPSFVNSMNNKAKQFGLSSLRFCTPHGLPPGDTGTCMDQGNAKDLYKLAQITVKDYSEYLNFSKNKTDYVDNGNTKVTSTNSLLGNVLGVDGIKTGYHNAAGSNIVLTADRGGERMIAVILGSNRAKDRNAIGTKEINDYYANGYARKNKNYNTNNVASATHAVDSYDNIETYNANTSKETKEPKKDNFINKFLNKFVKKNDSDSESSAKKMKIINKNDVIAIATIENEKYNLYPSRDVEITATQRPNLKYTVNINSGVSKNSKGKIVGTYVATDGTLTYSGELIMK